MARSKESRCLTAQFVEARRANGRAQDYWDLATPGLHLRVQETGRKSWYFRFTLNSKRLRIRLGRYPAMTLADARQKAVAYRVFVDGGLDPRMAQRALRSTKKLLTSADRAGQNSADSQEVVLHPHSIEFLIAEFKQLFVRLNRDDGDYIFRVLDNEVLPHWAGRDARTITPREVIEFLDRIVYRGAKVMANRIGTIVSQLFLFGVQRSIVAASPVQLLFRPGGKERPRRRVFSEGELRIFLLDHRKGARTQQLAHMLKILLLTAVRRRELCHARREHIDLGKAEWLIPGNIAKNREPCIIPLSSAAVAEFGALMALRPNSEYVVPMRSRDAAINPRQLTRRVARCQARFQKLGIAKFIAHDLRRTCRTFLSRLGVNQFIAERVLNHKRRGVEGVYDLYEFLPEKRQALEKWAHYLQSVEAQAAAVRLEATKRAPTAAGGRSFTEAELRAFVRHYRKAARTRMLGHLVKILLLTSAEARELAAARWRDVDLVGRTWLIPGEAHEAYLVPLTQTAVAEFRALYQITGMGDFVVPLRHRNCAVNPNYLTRRLARCQTRFQGFGVGPFLPPDLQRTCHTTLIRLGLPQVDADRLVERLAKGIDGQYDVYEYLSEKRRALECWEIHVQSLEERSDNPESREKSVIVVAPDTQRIEPRIAPGPATGEVVPSPSTAISAVGQRHNATISSSGLLFAGSQPAEDGGVTYRFSITITADPITGDNHRAGTPTLQPESLGRT